MKQVNPTRGQFILNKVKLVKDGGLLATYTTSTVADDMQVNLRKVTIERYDYVHPDLQNAFDLLKPVVLRTFGLTSFLSIVDAKEFEATKAQSSAMYKFANDTHSRINVKGITLKEQGESRACIVTAMLDVMGTDQSSVINTPKISEDAGAFGFEASMFETIDTITDEVYNYIFEGKQAEASLFGEEEENKEDDLFTLNKEDEPLESATE